MKVGYDAKRAFFNNTGLGNYSRWLIEAVAKHYPANTCFLYTPKAKDNHRLGFLNNYTNIHIVTPKSKLFTAWWRTRGIVSDLKRDGIALYHGLSHELPSSIRQSGIRSVVTVHDLIFMRYPEQFGWINCQIYAAKIRHACKVADKIIAISQKTKDDLVELLNIPSDKIEVIYQGCDPVFMAKQSDAQKLAVKTKYNLPDKFLLSVGTIEERKNLLLITQALKDIADDVFLVVVGRPTKKYTGLVNDFLAANNLVNRVLFLKDVTFDELPSVYQSATAFVYPSLYEGFGIPVLEALNSGTPVIAATGSCLEEAGGPNSLYVNPADAGDLAEKINRVLMDEALRQEMIKKGLQFAANFAEEKLTQQLMQLYKNTLNHA
jgi:glycosyltransferase involved in cell wall biosynthesis